MIAVALWYVAGTIVLVPFVMLIGLLFKPLLRYELVNVLLVLPGMALVAITAMTIPSVLLLDIITIVRGISGTTYNYEWLGIGLFTIGAIIATADVLFFMTGFRPNKRPKLHESLTRDAVEPIEGAADTADGSDGGQ